MSLVDQRAHPPRLAERTPLDWHELLLQRLAVQAVRVALFEAYYDGFHPLQFATSKFREAFGMLFSAFADNWCQIVVDAAVERLRVVGFQVDGESSDDAWTVWQHSFLDVDSIIAHTEAGKAGRAYLLVDPTQDPPRISIEHASQVVVARDPADRRRRVAALKRWLGDDGYHYSTLYLPDVVYRFESKEPTGDAAVAVQWVARSDDEPEVPNPLGVVPMIQLDNKPGLIDSPWAPSWGRATGPGRSHSDLEPAIPLQNAVNKLCSDLLIGSEYGAFPQRVVTGVEVPKDPETGQPLADVELKAAMSRLWAFKPADAKVASLPAADLNNYVVAIEMFIAHLAAQTRTPPHYLLAKTVNVSGDALQVAESGLVSKCRSKALFFSDAWEEAIALALTAAGDDVAYAHVEAVWSSPERQSLAQQTDAAVKKKTLGVPLPVIWLELGYTPQQIEEMKLDEAAAAAALAASNPTPPPTGPEPPAAPPTTGGTSG